MRKNLKNDSVIWPDAGSIRFRWSITYELKLSGRSTDIAVQLNFTRDMTILVSRSPPVYLFISLTHQLAVIKLNPRRRVNSERLSFDRESPEHRPAPHLRRDQAPTVLYTSIDLVPSRRRHGPRTNHLRSPPVKAQTACLRFLAKRRLSVGYMTKSHTPLTPPTRLRTRLPVRIASEKYEKVPAITDFLPADGCAAPKHDLPVSMVLACASTDFDEEDILAIIKRPKPATTGRRCIVFCPRRSKIRRECGHIENEQAPPPFQATPIDIFESFPSCSNNTVTTDRYADEKTLLISLIHYPPPSSRRFSEIIARVLDLSLRRATAPASRVHAVGTRCAREFEDGGVAVD
ncbi:hypothetical protein R3P38DRAFT_3283423 [Favolaschia claudopus]|uniref:Uncharacterized protein n=1 Tax=Favolaschia claudopus TaxID=2862362 RepID=A0AAW0A9X5_9AGAR